MNNSVLLCLALSFFVVQAAQPSPEFMQQFSDTALNCEKYCVPAFTKIYEKKACGKGCRLLTVISLAKNLKKSDNETIHSCYSSCKEAYDTHVIEYNACEAGCRKEASFVDPRDKNFQTLHVLTPLMYVRSAYQNVMNHLKQFVTTGFTLYVEEDTGKLVMMQSSPKAIVIKDKVVEKATPKKSADWMDCISQQSGLPRWILLVVLCAFIITLMWLCCVTTATAPNHHIVNAKVTPKNDVTYLYLYEPVDEMKIQPPAYEEVDPLLEKKDNLA